MVKLIKLRKKLRHEYQKKYFQISFFIKNQKLNTNSKTDMRFHVRLLLQKYRLTIFLVRIQFLSFMHLLQNFVLYAEKLL